MPAWPDGQRPVSRPGPRSTSALGAFMDSFNKDLAESGELVETRGLAAPVHTRRIQLQQGVPVVTDGHLDLEIRHSYVRRWTLVGPVGLEPTLSSS